jgi:hypothetical protein
MPEKYHDTDTNHGTPCVNNCWHSNISFSLHRITALKVLDSLRCKQFYFLLPDEPHSLCMLKIKSPSWMWHDSCSTNISVLWCFHKYTFFFCALNSCWFSSSNMSLRLLISSTSYPSNLVQYLQVQASVGTRHRTRSLLILRYADFGSWLKIQVLNSATTRFPTLASSVSTDYRLADSELIAFRRNLLLMSARSNNLLAGRWNFHAEG